MAAGARSTWGVFAAEGPGTKLQAEPDAGGWRLTGVKPWCSLADRLSHALVTAHTGDGHRRLFAVALRDPTVSATSTGWISRGLRGVPSGPVEFSGALAVPVGPDEWYLTRPGFAWGGAGVAACWFGGAVGVARSLFEWAQLRSSDQIARLHLGAADVALAGARSVLASAAARIDAGQADGTAGVELAGRVRGVVTAAADEVLGRSGRAMGPAPLAFDEPHARRVADLQIYLRQDHAERDRAALGGQLLAGPVPW